MFKLKNSYSTKDSVFLPIFIILVSIVYSFLFSLIITKVAVSSGAKTEEAIQEFAALPWVTIINMIVGQIFMIGTFVVYSLYNGKKIMTASTVKGRFRVLPILVIVAITAISLFGFNYLISLVDFSIFKVTKIEQALTAVPSGFGGYVITIFAFAIIPAIVEEFIYRGVVYNGLKKSYKPWKAIVLSAVIFALVHFNIYQTFYQFIMGVIMGAICYYTGSIIYSMIFHVLNNFLAVTLSFYAPSLFNVDMSALNVTLIILGAIAAAGAIVGLFVLLKKLCKKYDTKAEVVEEKSEEEQLLESSAGLSEYDIRSLHPSSLSNSKLVGVLIAVLAVLWVITNFI